MRKADKRARGEARQQVYAEQVRESGLAAQKSANRIRAEKSKRAREEKTRKKTREQIRAMARKRNMNEDIVLSNLNEIYQEN